MSRRQSRVSIDVRQNDTLLEFENFKKKFLLANKHITKLNSTLSARIEELQAQISTLYVENLRLRASEIALTSQLKKEREKSRKILADTESATHTLMKQLGLIRKSFGVPHGRSSTPESHPQPPRAKRPIPDPNVSPPPNRIARPPTIPVLLEDEEPNQSSPEDIDVDELRESSPTLPKKRTKTKSRMSSTSRLPVPLSKSPPPAVEVIQLDFDDQLNKTGKRRPSRRQSGLLTSVSITATVTDGLDRPPSPAPASPMRRALEEDEIAAAEPDEDEVEAILQSVTKRKSKKDRESDRVRDSDVDMYAEVPRPRERKKRVTEEPLEVPEGSKSKLKDVTNAQASRATLPLLDTMSDRDRQHTPDVDAPTSATSYASTSTRNFLSTPATTPAPLSKPPSQLLTPRSSSPVEPPPQSESEPSTTGRERRVRKSINYAEPKLNTKMRKPDPVPSAASATSKRSSTSGAHEEPLPLSSRSSSSNTADAETEPALAGTTRRKKSRAYALPEDEDESEGTQADAEFGGLRTGNWGSVDARRRSVHASSARRVEGDDIRRHSMAV
ncbi:hypothetical protein DICSQDRAFT_91447 [Dichomitus squalens LYAD-421 SS1]|uniref:Uncharacterized protein n=1 Tax=Dichomitus squalens (strain LYAD-421) TaxID=732165 RepID=R7SQJ0_DICSQ|nr:uncharacterized protein DICSQDRAFT_91447 [Dichomitus squalens LYAD-421 SS1]EJF58035.1 hypothetical protein DICSQDRAFT_91447 [Dichomitus squalens LYAD-421 SS1]